MSWFGFPGWPLREPLRPHPFMGALVGSLTGLMFGVLAGGSAFPADWASEVVGFCLGGLVTGCVVGGSLPLFRHRWIAGGIVAVGVGAGLAIADGFWHEIDDPAMILFLGFAHGFVYAMLFWDYRPDSNRSATSQRYDGDR